ncbi:Gfo/Idh/MocA family oxidoreductase [Bacillaceae bacterium]
MKKIRVGVLGVGRFGRLHLRVLRQFPHCEVVAIADVNEELLREVAEEFAIEQTYVNAEEMIRHPHLDVIDIVCDEDAHGRYVIEALRQRKHVFVEKPLATSYREAEKIGRLAKSAGKVVMVGNISRFSQPYIAIKRAVESGAIGQLGMIRAKRHFSKAWFDHFGKRVHPVYESGIHDLDLVLWLADSPCREVYAVERHVSGYAYPDLFSVILTFANGVIASLDSAWLVPEAAPQNLVETLELDGTIDADLEVVGTKGNATFHMLQAGLSIWTERQVLHPELTLWPTEHDGIGGAIRAELQHFLNQVEKGSESPVAPLTHSVEALKIADAIVLSARERRVISL